MTNPIIRFHNTETNEVIDREMNDTEYAQYQIDQADFAVREQVVAEQATAKAALLTKLGITAEEAALLLGGN
jgi:hypothetical protein